MPIIIFLVASDDSALDTTPVVVPGCPNFLILKNEFAATVLLVIAPWPKLFCDEDTPTTSFITNCFVITNIADIGAVPSPLIPAEDSGAIAVPFMLIVNKLKKKSVADESVAIENDIS